MREEAQFLDQKKDRNGCATDARNWAQPSKFSASRLHQGHIKGPSASATTLKPHKPFHSLQLIG